MKNTEKTNFNDLPAKGTYERLAGYLIDSFKEDNLPDYVYYDLALATGELMQPMRKYAKTHLSTDHLKKCFDDKHNKIGKSIFVLRLIPFGSDDEDFYNELKKIFLDIKLPDSNQWLHQKKQCLSIVLPYFKQYNSDEGIENEMYEYFESTPSEHIETILQYLGGVEKFADGFIKALNDSEKRSKHWVYIWCFKAICMKGLFDKTVIIQLKNVIEKYVKDQETYTTDFDKKIIKESLAC
jgi:hypothetical protein